MSENSVLEKMKKEGMVYLASPYSKYEDGLEMAFEVVSSVAASLIKRGVKVYSPIAHSHPIAMHGRLDPLDYKIWLPYDQAMMDRSTAICVATMEGWEKSFGVRHEIAEFRGSVEGHLECDWGFRPRPIYFIDPVTEEVF